MVDLVMRTLISDDGPDLKCRLKPCISLRNQLEKTPSAAFQIIWKDVLHS